jgi:hypothetical protein
MAGDPLQVGQLISSICLTALAPAPTPESANCAHFVNPTSEASSDDCFQFCPESPEAP